VATQFRLESLAVSPSGVRGVWLHRNLETRRTPLLRLEQAVPRTPPSSSRGSRSGPRGRGRRDHRVWFGRFR